jgi:hypothetical protein
MKNLLKYEDWLSTAVSYQNKPARLIRRIGDELEIEFDGQSRRISVTDPELRPIHDEAFSLFLQTGAPGAEY